ncbi:MAG: class I tRNA ligase family protein [Candidatus Liptonbacteria bacterium]|nr:class I tRNA ligase family protein [Candidatus Liptonbacteria bacterium]
MPESLESRYDHKATEEKIYRLWEKSGYFNPDNLPFVRHTSSVKSHDAKAKSFCIIMPPPNANGALHIGHAVGVTLQDIMVRFNRMRGKKTLWLPGADHAGFETQVVFDKKLDKEGRNRFVMDREELWKEIWDFTQKNKEIMYGQLKKLGASCDWSREKFTLDPDIVKTVYDTFEKLYEDGLVYRDLRVINWCPKHRTALSDLEVKYVEREDPLYYIKYGPLTLATVRPETKFGDTALAVNPKDKRYTRYVGKEIEAKGVLGTLKFKVVADEAVDPKFGTGVVKVTPAHDPADFEIWQRHKNEIPGPKIVIDESGRLTGDVGEFKGLKVAEAREKVAAKMKEIGILEKIDEHYTHQVATCYKCGNILEPLPKPQWFIRMTAKPQPKTSNIQHLTSNKSLRDMAVEAVRKGKIKFIPKRIEKVYFHWLKNIRDWNISRQIVWGIRIPAYFCLGCGEPKINPEVKARWFLVRHGETDWNKEGRLIGNSDIPLNDMGRSQARATAKKLKLHNIDLIISSPLARCRETAEIIRDVTGAELIFEDRLIERNHGKTEGMLRKDAEKEFGNLYTYEPRIPGSEGYRDVELRAWEAFTHHKNDHHHKNVVFVTHGGVVRTLLKKLRNWEVERMFQNPSVKNSEVFEFDVLKKQCTKCGGDLFEQDPDVFDTWFSSAQWPFATLMISRGSKSKIKSQKLKSDFEEFYPTDVMETGYDILFFWVARMVMMGLYRTGKIPFKTVYLNGLVRDKDREKMSKSKGNVIDPLGVAEIYGTDAVRMALVVGNAPGNDIVISEDKIRGYRNFATKLWNIARFVVSHKSATSYQQPAASKNKEDRENLAELKKIKAKITRHVERFEFHLAAETIYHYIWHTFADKIIERYKPRLRGESFAFGAAMRPSGHGAPRSGASEGASPARLLAGQSSGSQGQKILTDRAAAYHTLETIFAESLKMLHPFMPFVTEEIFQKLFPGELLVTEKW